MSLHLIPDDGAPHAPTSECGCDPQVAYVDVRGYRRPAYVHNEQGGGPDEASPAGPAAPDAEDRAGPAPTTRPDV